MIIKNKSRHAVSLLGLLLFLILAVGSVDDSGSTGGSSGSSNSSTKPRPTRPPAQTIPTDITYSIIDSNIMFPYKRSLDVRLNKIVSKTTLHTIAIKLKAQDSRNYERTFICYYLPDMEVGAGAWASTHFDPKLEVKIFGITNEAIELFLKKSTFTTGIIIGEWIDAGLMPRKITVFQENNKYYLERLFFDGSSGKVDLIKKGFKYFAKDSSAGDHYVVLSNGKLEIRDDSGLICKAKPIGDFKSSDKQTGHETKQPNINKANAQAEKPLTIGISYNQIMEDFDEWISLSKSSDVRGQPRYMGQTLDNGAALEIIGNKTNISQATLMVGFPNDAPKISLRNSGLLLLFIKDIAPEWESGSDWTVSALKRLTVTGKPEKIIKGNKSIKIHKIEALGLVVVTVKHKNAN